MITLSRFGITYSEGQRCPACSSEIDKGGRLVGLKRKREYLKCTRCRYSLLSEETIISREKRAKRQHDRDIGIKDTKRFLNKKLTKRYRKFFEHKPKPPTTYQELLSLE